MAYGDDLEREFTDRMHRWARAQYEREEREFGLSPDERLDDLGWEIFYCATARGMAPDRAAQLALDGNLRQRLRVSDDIWHRHGLALQQLVKQYRPASARFDFYESQAPDQLAFWRGQSQSSFVTSSRTESGAR